MSTATMVWKSPRTHDGVGYVPEGSDIPIMRPRIARNASDADMIGLLREAQENLAQSTCCFWACEGPSRPRGMCTCRKCYAMRQIGTVLATLEARFA